MAIWVPLGVYFLLWIGSVIWWTVALRRLGKQMPTWYKLLIGAGGLALAYYVALAISITMD